MSEPKLKRNLSFISMIALAAGAVIGGWLAEAPYWFSLTGTGGALVFPILAVLLVPVGLAFSELTAMLPFASSVDVWTVNALGHKAGWATQWLMFLVQVVEPPMMAFIFVTVVQYFVPISSTTGMMIAIAVIILWFILSNFNVGLTGTLANIFFFSMIVMSLIVCACFYFSGHWSTENVVANGGMFPNGFHGVFVAMAVFSLKFIGFEMTPTMIEETTFPANKMWKVILSALFAPAILYFIVVMAIGGMAPWDQIAEMGMPEPELVAQFSLPAIIGIIAIVAGMLHAFTTLMGFWTSSARVIYGAAELNQLPKTFSKLNSKGQPYIANIVVLAFSIFFCFFTGDDWVQYIYSVSCAAAGLVYFVCCLDALMLRKKHPEWNRPYKTPAGNVLFVIGMLISVWIIIGSCLELPIGGYISLAIYCVIGVAIYVGMSSRRKKNPGQYELITLTPDDIGKTNA